MARKKYSSPSPNGAIKCIFHSPRVSPEARWLTDTERAIKALTNEQRQLDEDGIIVGVSRQAIAEVLADYASLRAQLEAQAGRVRELTKAMVRLFPDRDPWINDDGECCFCGMGWNEADDVPSNDPRLHKSDCAWIGAVALLPDGILKTPPPEKEKPFLAPKEQTNG